MSASEPSIHASNSPGGDDKSTVTLTSPENGSVAGVPVETPVEPSVHHTEIEAPPEEEEEHQSWGSKLSYILTLVGYAVGFGNVWRFPFLLQRNGGAAFLIPYVCMLAFLGIPGFFLELAIGQRLRKGSLGCWQEVSPYIGGIGITAGLTCIIVGLYYTALIAYCFSYLFDSFQLDLPWEDCDNALGLKKGECRAPNTMTHMADHDECSRCQKGTASQFYWYEKVLNISPDIEDPGRWNTKVAMFVILSWFLIWVILVKGIKATGKIVYFTALFPYVVLLIFFIFALTTDGMLDGFRVLFTPDFSVLLSGNVWLAAGTQIFFSLGLGFGSLIAFASYLPSNNDCYTDAVRVSLINCGTSLFAACTIFPILGYAGKTKYKQCLHDLATRLYTDLLTDKFNPQPTIAFYDNPKNPLEIIIVNGANYSLSTYDQTKLSDIVGPGVGGCDLDQNIKDSGSGPGLVFIAFADAIIKLPFPPIWAVLFFMMLLTLGIDSGFGTVEGGVAVVIDLFKFKSHGRVTTFYCAISCIFSMLFCCGWGQHVVSLLDQFIVNYCLLLIVFFEAIGISYIYGLKQFAYDIKLMTGRRPNVYLLVCWKFLAPVIMLALLISSVYQFITGGLTYDGWNTINSTSMSLTYPTHIVVIGSVCAIISVMWTPLLAILHKLRVDPLPAEQPAFFPEDELRDIRNITSDEAEEQGHSPLEKAMFWSEGNVRRSSHSPSMKDTTSLHSHQDDVNPVDSGSGSEFGQNV